MSYEALLGNVTLNIAQELARNAFLLNREFFNWVVIFFFFKKAQLNKVFCNLAWKACFKSSM